MKEWYLMNPQPTLNSGFENDEFTDYSTDSFDEILSETPLGKDIYLCKGKFDGENFEIEIPTKAVIQSETPDSTKQSWVRQILGRVGELSDYKYVKYKGEIWLIFNEPSDNMIYDKAILLWCNWIGKWQNNQGKVIYKPFNVQNASQYNSGIEESKIITIGYNQLILYGSLDEETKYLGRDKRMFIDYNDESPIPYKITRPDTVSYSFGKDRTICLLCTEEQYNPKTDRIDLMLCDYFTPLPQTIPVQIKFAGEPEIRCGGSAKTFTVDTDKIVTWSLTILNSQKDYISITVDNQSPNSVKLKCLKNYALIGSSFKLICEVNNTKTELLIDIVGGV